MYEITQSSNRKMDSGQRENRNGFLSMTDENISQITAHLPLSWGGTNRPSTVSGILFGCGKFPFGTLLRGREEANIFASLLRDSRSAIAAATRKEWSEPLARSDDTGVEFKRSEASGSLRTEGSDG